MNGRGLSVKLWHFLDFGIVFVMKSRWTRSIYCGPRAASVHLGPEQWSGGGLTRARARGRSGEWELTMSWGRGRGAPGGPHRQLQRLEQRWNRASGDGQRRRRSLFDAQWYEARVGKMKSGTTCDEGLRC
jgi:hypothetical protein